MKKSSRIITGILLAILFAALGVWGYAAFVTPAQSDYRAHIAEEFRGEIVYHEKSWHGSRVIAQLTPNTAAALVRNGKTPFTTCSDGKYTCTSGMEQFKSVKGMQSSDTNAAKQPEFNQAITAPFVCQEQTATTNATRTYCLNPESGKALYILIAP